MMIPHDIAADKKKLARWVYDLMLTSHISCRGYEIEIFDPWKDDTYGVEYAKRICYTCPMLEHCRMYADITEMFSSADGKTYLIYGAETPIERKNRRKNFYRKHRGYYPWWAAPRFPYERQPLPLPDTPTISVDFLKSTEKPLWKPTTTMRKVAA